MLEDYQKKIIDLLYKQESLLARLYQVFADQFPDFSDFWQELMKEEEQHAEWIKKFYQAEKKDLVAFSEGKIKTYTMNSFIENLERTIGRAEKREINLKMAIAYTLDFERSLIEKNVFSHFQVIDETVQGIMGKIAHETRRHAKKAEDMMARLNN